MREDVPGQSVPNLYFCWSFSVPAASGSSSSPHSRLFPRYWAWDWRGGIIIRFFQSAWWQIYVEVVSRSVPGHRGGRHWLRVDLHIRDNRRVVAILLVACLLGYLHILRTHEGVIQIFESHGSSLHLLNLISHRWLPKTWSLPSK
jgi:hypothetical protein